MTKVVLNHCSLRSEVVDVLRGRLRRYDIVQLIAFAQIELHEPSRKYHPLSEIL
jgi:hypothetical protein